MLAPLNVTIRHAEFRYRPDWTPTAFTLDATVDGRRTAAQHDIRRWPRVHRRDNTGTAGVGRRTRSLRGHSFTSMASSPPTSRSPVVSWRTQRRGPSFASTSCHRPRSPFVSRAILASGCRSAPTSSTCVGSSWSTSIPREKSRPISRPKTTAGWSESTIPAQSLDIVREDVASSTSRTQIYSNPGDEAVTIPAAGFNLGATLTRPGGRRDRHPAPERSSCSSSGVGDRDGVVQGVPTLAQLAGAIADAGMLAVRYDKRGNGQSGGRSESATIADFAEDVRVVVRWLEKAPGRRPETHRGRRTRRRRLGRIAGGLARAADRRVVSIAGAVDHRRRAWCSSSSVMSLESAKASAGRARQANRAPAADPFCGADGQGLGHCPAAASQRGRYALVPERADLRSGQGHRRRASADAVRSRRPGPPGSSGARRTPVRPGAQGEPSRSRSRSSSSAG